MIDPGESFVVVESFTLRVGAVFGADDAAGFLVWSVVQLDFGVLELSFEGRWGHLDQDAVFKNTTHDFISGQINLPLAILNPIFPLALIKRPIGPKHLSIGLSLIVDKVSFVEVAAWKIQFSIAFFESLDVVPDVFGFVLRPLAFAVPETVLEGALVGSRVIGPSINAKPVKPAVLELAFVRVAVDEFLFSLPVFQPVYKDSVIDGLPCLEESLPVHDAQFPLPEILVFLCVDIVAIGPVSQSVHEMALINCLVLQDLQALALLDIVLEEASENSHVWIVVHALAVSFVVDDLALVHCAVLEYDNAVAVALVLCDLADVNLVLSNSADFHPIKVFFHLIDELLVEGFVELGEELLDFEFGEFFSPQEGVLGVVLGLGEESLLEFIELALGKFSKDAVVRLVGRFLGGVVLLGLLLEYNWECGKFLLFVALTVEVVHCFLSCEFSLKEGQVRFQQFLSFTLCLVIFIVIAD